MRRVLLGTTLWLIAATTLPASRAAHQSPAPAAKDAAVVVDVEANRPWTETGMLVRKGDLIRFEVTGEISVKPDGATFGPEGLRSDEDIDRGLPLRVAAGGALIGAIETPELPFAIGRSQKPIKMPASGRLLLGVNDVVFRDNRGAFQVRVVR